MSVLVPSPCLEYASRPQNIDFQGGRIILCRIKKLEEFEIDLGFILLVSHNSIVLISEPIFQVCTTELAQGL